MISFILHLITLMIQEQEEEMNEANEVGKNDRGGRDNGRQEVNDQRTEELMKEVSADMLITFQSRIIKVN